MKRCFNCGADMDKMLHNPYTDIWVCKCGLQLGSFAYFNLNRNDNK